MQSPTSIAVQNGEHRRNLVTRNVRLETLAHKRFRIGDAYFAFDRLRPPCLYLQKLTEPGMVAALVNRSGICVCCFRSGIVRENDSLEIIHLSACTAITQRVRKLLSAR